MYDYEEVESAMLILTDLLTTAKSDEVKKMVLEYNIFTHL